MKHFNKAIKYFPANRIDKYVRLFLMANLLFFLFYKPCLGLPKSLEYCFYQPVTDKNAFTLVYIPGFSYYYSGFLGEHAKASTLINEVDLFCKISYLTFYGSYSSTTLKWLYEEKDHYKNNRYEFGVNYSSGGRRPVGLDTLNDKNIDLPDDKNSHGGFAIFGYYDDVSIIEASRKIYHLETYIFGFQDYRTEGSGWAAAVYFGPFIEYYDIDYYKNELAIEYNGYDYIVDSDRKALFLGISAGVKASYMIYSGIYAAADLGFGGGGGLMGEDLGLISCGITAGFIPVKFYNIFASARFSWRGVQYDYEDEIEEAGHSKNDTVYNNDLKIGILFNIE